MHKTTICLLSVILFMSMAQTVFAKEGIYISRPYDAQEKDKIVEDLIREYTQAMIKKTFLENSRDTVERIGRRQNLQLIPQMVMLTINQIAIQALKQPDILDIAKDAYRESYDSAMEEYEEGLSQDAIQRNIESNVKAKIEPVFEGPLYRRIIELSIQQAMSQQRRVLMMEMMQRQAQMAAIVRQQQALSEQLQKEYISSILVR